MLCSAAQHACSPDSRSGTFAQDLLLRYGFGPEFKLIKSINGSLANTLKGSPGNVRFASFSPDGTTIMAASDGKATED